MGIVGITASRTFNQFWTEGETSEDEPLTAEFEGYDLTTNSGIREIGLKTKSNHTTSNGIRGTLIIFKTTTHNTTKHHIYPLNLETNRITLLYYRKNIEETHFRNQSDHVILPKKKNIEDTHFRY